MAVNSYVSRLKTAKNWSIESECVFLDTIPWNVRCGGSGNYGKFIDLMDNGKEILATTEKGLFYSTNKGLSWNVRKRG